MASSTRNRIPFASSPLLNRCPRCLHIRPKLSRQLSSTPCRKAKNALPPNRKEALKPMGSRRSRKVEMKRMSASKIPNDLGIIQQTFIRPPNRDMPRLFSKKWKSRLKVEWFWIKTRFMNFGSLIHFLYWSERKIPKSERMPLDLQSRPSIALHLHKKFYTNLASGDFTTLRPILCTGLSNTAQSQISQRTENNQPPQTWTLIRYTSPLKLPFSWRFLPWPLTSLFPFTQAKILSDRVVPLPIGNNVCMRQCVVRIRSLQSLDKADGSTPSQADLTEYLVMQRMRLPGGKVDGWQVWGTTKPTSEQEMERLIEGGAAEGEQKMTLMDRLRAADPTRGF